MTIIVSTGRVKEQGLTVLNREANRIDQLEQDLILLKRGVPIEKPVYNHSTGSLTRQLSFIRKKSLFLKDFTHCLHPTLRKYLDFSLFVDPSKNDKI